MSDRGRSGGERTPTTRRGESLACPALEGIAKDFHQILREHCPRCCGAGGRCVVDCMAAWLPAAAE